MRDFNFCWAESIITFAQWKTSHRVIINAFFFSSEVEITTQQIDYCFESDNLFH